MSILYDIIESWANTEGNVSTNDEIMEWIKYRTDNLKVNIVKTDFPEEGFWLFDKETGMIRNRNNSFFQIAGCQEVREGDVIREQPVIMQMEIGYLGIIAKKIDGVLNFLMQAKIEPGNVNSIQISPTIQATKSNFTRKHGGNAPAYLEFFERADEYPIIVDQVQSEQSSRFYKKRNRNIMILVDDDVEVLSSHKWMTLGQIKKLMRHDNIVNMDSRTVLSGIHFDRSLLDEGEYERAYDLFEDKALFRSMFETDRESSLHYVFNHINNEKMFCDFDTKIVPLESMESWKITDSEIVCKKPYDFKVIYCQIEIEGREVRFWEQPLVEANGMLLLGLFTRIHDGKREFLVKIRHEFGCFDVAELSPTIQLEPTNPPELIDSVEQTFMDKLNANEGILKNVILSEEGGRFYHEQNHNVIIEVPEHEIGKLPSDYHWVSYNLLSNMVQYSNYLNIQLRNLLSILDL